MIQQPARTSQPFSDHILSRSCAKGLGKRDDEVLDAHACFLSERRHKHSAACVSINVLSQHLYLRLREFRPASYRFAFFSPLASTILATTCVIGTLAVAILIKRNNTPVIYKSVLVRHVRGRGPRCAGCQGVPYSLQSYCV
jgi:hypothetical protein